MMHAPWYFVTASKMSTTNLTALRPSTDTKEYAVFQLPSGFAVAVIHEATQGSKKAVVSLAVGGRAGSFADPDARQGLAHFCEHAMFMGSALYPKENEYDDFLARNSGQSNAFTDNEATVYQMEVTCNTEAVDGALGRLAAFFIHPLFSEGSVEREVKAVDTEYRRAAREDGIRLSQVQAHSYAASHPYSCFSWGNAASLWGRKTGVNGVPDRGEGDATVADLIGQLRAYHSATYLAKHMTLCIRADGNALAPSSAATGNARDGLTVLEALIRKHFGAVPDSPPAAFGKEHFELPAGQSTGACAAAASQLRSCDQTMTWLATQHGHRPENRHPFGLSRSPLQLSSSGSPLVYFLAPVGSRHTISLTWPLPPLQTMPWLRSGPEHTLSHILGHEAQGSLLPALREAGWAVELQAGIGGSGGTDSSSVCSLFSINITATLQGVCHWREVVTAVYSYIVHILCTGSQASSSAQSSPVPAAPFDPSITYCLLSGQQVNGSRLNSLTARMQGLEWCWTESSVSSRLEYHYGDSPDPWDQTAEIAQVLAKGLCEQREVLLAASGVIGPFIAGPESSTDPARYCPAMVAYLAAHLNPHNCRVDILSPLCGVEGARGAEADEEGGDSSMEGSQETGDEGSYGDDGDGDDDGDESYEDGGDDGGLRPDPRLSLLVSVESKSKAAGTDVADNDVEAEVADLLTSFEAESLTKAVEPYFFSEYAYTPIDPSTLGHWMQPPAIAVEDMLANKGKGKKANGAQDASISPTLRKLLRSLRLPPANPYLPTDFSMRVATAVASEPAEVLLRVWSIQGDGIAECSASAADASPCLIGRLWYAPNGSFRAPRASITATIHTPALYASAHACAAADVWQSLVLEGVNNDIYLASLAALDGSLSTLPGVGWRVHVGGIGQHAGLLLSHLTAALTCTVPDAAEPRLAADDMPSILPASTKGKKGSHKRPAPSSSSSEHSHVAAPVRISEWGTISVEGSTVVRWTDNVLREYEDALLAPGVQAGAAWFEYTVSSFSGQAGSIRQRQEALQEIVRGAPKARKADDVDDDWSPTLRSFLGLPVLRKAGEHTAPVPCMWAFKPGAPLVVDLVVTGNETLEGAQAHLSILCEAIRCAAERWWHTLSSKDRNMVQSVQPSAVSSTTAGSGAVVQSPRQVVSKAGFSIAKSPYTHSTVDTTQRIAVPAEACQSWYPLPLVGWPVGTREVVIPPPEAYSPSYARHAGNAELSVQLTRVTEPAISEHEVNSVVQVFCNAGPARVEGSAVVDEAARWADSVKAGHYPLDIAQWPVLRRRALLSFLCLSCSEPFFDSLRTRQQLGYEVYCSQLSNGSFAAGRGVGGGGVGGSAGAALGLVFCVESASHAPADVESRILAFLREFRAREAGAASSLPDRLQAWATAHKQPLESLSDVADDAWEQVTSGRCEWFPVRRAIEVACLLGEPTSASAAWPGLSTQELLTFIDTLFLLTPASLASGPGLLSVHVLGKGKGRQAS